MYNVQVTSLFCEDIRYERSGQRSLVGIFNDNISISKFPGQFARLCVFARVSAPVELSIRHLAHKVIGDDGTEISEITVEQELIESTRDYAKNQGNPLYGFMSEFKFTSFQITSSGMIEVISEVDEARFRSGFLSITARTDDD